MNLLKVVEALLRRDAVKANDGRTIVALDVGPEVAERFVVVGDVAADGPITLGAALDLVADLDAITLDEAFLIDAIKQGETTASSTYLARVLDRLHALA